MRCDIGHRHGPDLALLWLWHRPEAVAPIRLLAWEPLYAMSVVCEVPPPLLSPHPQLNGCLGDQGRMFWGPGV